MRARGMQHAKQCSNQIARASASASRDRHCVATPAFSCEDWNPRHRCHVTQKAAMRSAGTCCHGLAGGCDLARLRQRRRAPLVWSDVSLAPLTFTARWSGCYCSRRRRFRSAECEQRQHDRLRASEACIPLPCSRTACCSSRPAMFTLSGGFLSFNRGSHRLEASVPRVGLGSC
jgi:hypothetical protein